MKIQHTPRVNLRYWSAIALASVFGTNMGDLYAHSSRLGIVRGVALLALLTLIVFCMEHFDMGGGESFYWIVILLIRTGATNIADYLAYRVRIPVLPLTAGFAALLALFAWLAARNWRYGAHRSMLLPPSNTAYWLAMLVAGIFGTIVGDLCEHAIGQGPAALALGILLAFALLAGRTGVTTVVILYWTSIAVARTAGTAMGDWLAESKPLNLGLPASTLLSGLLFLAVVVLWHSAKNSAQISLKVSPEGNTVVLTETP